MTVGQSTNMLRNMSRGVRVAIAGAGFIGAVHARSARLAGGRLVGVAASSPARSERAAASLGAERSFASAEELVASDLEFHRGIVQASGNSVLCSLLDGLSGPTTRARVWRGLTQEDAVSRTLLEHRAILAAMRDRDAEAARSWATVHVASVEQWLRSTL